VRAIKLQAMTSRAIGRWESKDVGIMVRLSG
jgi:hypothetical protein